jgi:hypothetical protein
MKDFTIQINDVKVDRYTQDARVAKMKLYLHFTNLLRNRREVDNKMEVIDVTLSLYNLPKYLAVFKMQDV